MACRAQQFPGGGGGCASLRARMQAVDFAIVETALYLDAYPECRAAMAYYQKLIAERETLAEAVHAQCGPTTARDNKNPASWDWIKGPWPWQAEANDK